MSHHRYTFLDELRESTRFEKERGTDVAVILKSPGQELLVDVHDESLGGIAVFIEDAACFAVGCETDIVYQGEYFRARVCHVEPQQEGGYVVGFACQRIEGVPRGDDSVAAE